MRIEDLIIGEVYWTKPYSSVYLMLHDGISKDNPKVNKTKGNIYFRRDGIAQFHAPSSNFSSEFGSCRLATYEEKQWLLACIAANRLVNPSKTNYYEIY